MKKITNTLNGEEDFFVLTNPLLYIYILILLTLGLLNKLLQLSGLYDWYTAIFRIHKFTEQQKKLVVDMHKNRKRKIFFLKKMAWNYGVKKITNA